MTSTFNTGTMIQELKKQQQEKYSQLFKECGVFFAFSNQQFAQNKTPLKEGEKYVSIGAGGYMPAGNVQKYIAGSKEIAQWFKQETAKSKASIREHILYELNNHECFYTCDPTDALAVLPYPKKQVLRVFSEERQRLNA